MPPGSSSTPGRVNRTVRDTRIEPHVAVADASESGAHLRGARQTSLSLVEAPGLHQRADGDVERAVALPAVLQTTREQREQLVRHPHGATTGLTVHRAPLAGRLVVGEQLVEAMDFPKRRIGGRLEARLLAAVQDDREARAHDLLVSLELQEIGRLARRLPGWRRQEDREREGTEGSEHGARPER